MSRVIMEREYDSPRTQGQVDEMNGAMGPCLEVNGVRHLETMVNTERTRFLCTFDAPDAETVRRAIKSSGVDYKDIWAADVFTSG